MSVNQAATGVDRRAFILTQAIPLFAATGYSGVSMRDISRAVGISKAALYYHFPDKQALYLAAVDHAFADKAEGIRRALAGGGTAIERLERFVERFTALVAGDPDFRALLQRELVDGDETRLKLLADQVFLEPYEAIVALAKELAPDLDLYLLANSVVGLVLFGFETLPLRRHLPGRKPEHEKPGTIARHASALLVRALGVKAAQPGGGRSG